MSPEAERVTCCKENPLAEPPADSLHAGVWKAAGTMAHIPSGVPNLKNMKHHNQVHSQFSKQGRSSVCEGSRSSRWGLSVSDTDIRYPSDISRKTNMGLCWTSSKIADIIAQLKSSSFCSSASDLYEQETDDSNTTNPTLLSLNIILCLSDITRCRFSNKPHY